MMRIQTISEILSECVRDIRWEFNQIKSRLQQQDIDTLTDAVFNGTPPLWPAVIMELQRGYVVSRLQRHINYHIRQAYTTSYNPLVFQGPFPTLSLKALRPIAREHRRTWRLSSCIEFVGNKAWDHAVASVTPKYLPFKLNVATFALATLACSPNHLLQQSKGNLARCINGCIINFLHQWESLLIEQTTKHFTGLAASSTPNSEIAV